MSKIKIKDLTKEEKKNLCENYFDANERTCSIDCPCRYVNKQFYSQCKLNHLKKYGNTLVNDYDL